MQRWLAGFLHDVRFAGRYLKRHRAFTISGMAILGIGISLSATLFAVVKGALLEPWPYEAADRIVALEGNYPEQGRSRFPLWSAREVEDLRAESAIFEHVLAGDARNVNLTHAGRPERVRAAIITPTAFPMLGVPALLGRTLEVDDAAPGAAPTVLVSHTFWQQRLGADPRVLGRELRIADVPYQIVGVMPPTFRFWDRELWMPLRLDPAQPRTDRRYFAQARLRAGLDRSTAAAMLEGTAQRLRSDHPEIPEYRGFSIGVEPLLDAVLRDLRPTLYLLLGAVALVMAVAAANFATATLTRSLRRDAELALRRALGGSRSRIARQVLIESGIVGTGGAALGIGAAHSLLPVVLSLVPYGYIPAEARITLDWTVLLAAATVGLLSSLAFGIIPAVGAASVEPGVLLRTADTRTSSRPTARRWRSAFIIFQLTMTVMVLAGGAVALTALRAYLNRYPGFEMHDVWTARIALSPGSSAAQVYDRVLDSVSKVAGVTDVAASSASPVGTLPTVLVSRELAARAGGSSTLEADVLTVSPGFFRLLRIPVAEGRALAPADDEDTARVVVISRALASRLWPEGGAVGSRLFLSPDAAPVPATVVGVSGNVTSDPANAGVRPTVFVPLAQNPPPAVILTVRARDHGELLTSVQAAVAHVDPTIPVFRPEMLNDARRETLGPQLLAVSLLAVFGIAVLVLSTVGIYAVVTQSVQERTQEIGIRLALGARWGDVFAAELVRGGRLVSFSVIAGLIGTVPVLRGMAAILPNFGGDSVLPVAASAAAVVSIAMAAVVIPAVRVARIDLVAAMRGR